MPTAAAVKNGGDRSGGAVRPTTREKTLTVLAQIFHKNPNNDNFEAQAPSSSCGGPNKEKRRREMGKTVHSTGRSSPRLQRL